MVNFSLGLGCSDASHSRHDESLWIPLFFSLADVSERVLANVAVAVMEVVWWESLDDQG